jgi:hypothetical protein
MKHRISKIVNNILANGFKDKDSLGDCYGKEKQKSAEPDAKPRRTDLKDRSKPKNLSRYEIERDYGDTHLDKDLKKN